MRGRAISIIVTISLCGFAFGPWAQARPRHHVSRQPLTVVDLRARMRTPRPPVTPAPLSKPAVAPAPVVAPAPSGSVQERIVAAWPGSDKAKVLRVIGCESGFNPNARSSSGRFWGLFQADASFRATYGWGTGSIEDQVAMGWRGFQARGWSPWPVCGRR